MVFSSMIFLWLFLPIIFIVYRLVPASFKNSLLLIASLIFYAWGEPKYISLMLAVIGCNYIFGLWIDKEEGARQRKSILLMCIVINLAILGYFKYWGFIGENINQLVGKGMISTKNIILPIGISFYIFQAISYVVDVYRDKNEQRGVGAQRNIINLALYISFFPQLIAGPIVKYHDINEQLSNRQVTLEDTVYGIQRFICGLGKKVLISNVMAGVADEIFALNTSELNTSVAWLGIVCYTLQIYYDFSGYSDMAIGLGKMFGFTFMENFNYPYIGGSIGEFWRRWHISLSTWFKEYVYIPLGGNRRGERRTYINLLIVFFVTGLWHGANWTFVVWGMFHGVFLVIERMGLGRILSRNRFKFINCIYTLSVVMFGWVFFRADTLGQAIEYIGILLGGGNQGGLYTLGMYLDRHIELILGVGIMGMGILQGLLKGRFISIKNKWYSQLSEYSWWGVILLLSITALGSDTYNPFIYFRF